MMKNTIFESSETANDLSEAIYYALNETDEGAAFKKEVALIALDMGLSTKEECEKLKQLVFAKIFVDALNEYDDISERILAEWLGN